MEVLLRLRYCLCLCLLLTNPAGSFLKCMQSFSEACSLITVEPPTQTPTECTTNTYTADIIQSVKSVPSDCTAILQP